MHLLSSKCAESIDLLKKSIAKSLPYIKQTEQNLNQCPVEVILIVCMNEMPRES